MTLSPSHLTKGRQLKCSEHFISHFLLCSVKLSTEFCMVERLCRKWCWDIGIYHYRRSHMKSWWLDSWEYSCVIERSHQLGQRGLIVANEHCCEGLPSLFSNPAPTTNCDFIFLFDPAPAPAPITSSDFTSSSKGILHLPGNILLASGLFSFLPFFSFSLPWCT